MKKALITGVTGQDGAYLAELLLKNGYEVHGIKRRTSLFNTDRMDHVHQDPHVDNRKFILHYGDLTDSTSLVRIIQKVQPNEIYNLAAQSHVAESFEEPEYTANADGIGALGILEAIRILAFSASRRKPVSTKHQPQNFTGWCKRFHKRKPPLSIRAVPTRSPSSTPTGSQSTIGRHTASMRATVFSSIMSPPCVVNIRDAQNCACHCPNRLGLQDCLYLGNLAALRDWGHARHYVEMQWLMLQQEKPEDLVVGTGVQCSVRDFVLMSARELGVSIGFQGGGISEVGVVTGVQGDKARCKVGDVIVKVDTRYLRPSEVETLQSDFQPVIGPKTIGLSGGEFGLGVEALDHAARELAFGTEAVGRSLDEAAGYHSRPVAMRWYPTMACTAGP